MDDFDENEEPAQQTEEDEAYSVLMSAARYLEIGLRQARKVNVQEQQPEDGATYTARWKLTMNGLSCTVVRYERADGPDYQVLEA